jgi:hypothetical protein
VNRDRPLDTGEAAAERLRPDQPVRAAHDGARALWPAIRDPSSLGWGTRDFTRTDVVTTAGAIAFGLVLGVVLAQRTSLRAGTLAALVAAIAASAAVVWAVAGFAGALTVAIVAPLAYLLRRVFDGQRLATGP